MSVILVILVYFFIGFLTSVVFKTFGIIDDKDSNVEGTFACLGFWPFVIVLVGGFLLVDRLNAFGNQFASMLRKYFKKS